MASNQNGVNLSQPLVPIFQGSNYGVWSTKMKTLFLSQDLWDLVENGYGEEEVAAETLKDIRKRDAKALFFIQQVVDESIFPRIEAVTRSKEAWDMLRMAYQGTTKVMTVKLQTLRRKFDNFIMEEDDVLDDYVSKVIDVVNQIRKYGEDLSEQRVVEKILRSLPRKYDHVVATIEESKDLSVLTVDELQGSLYSHDDRMKRYDNASVENAFYSRVQYSHGGKGTSETNFNDWRGGNSSRGRRRDSEEDETESLLIACFIAKECSPEVWYIDNGCSNHMTSELSLFSNLDRLVTSRITLGDGTIRIAKGKGTVQLNSLGLNCIHNVLYVSYLNSNLLSVGQFMVDGYSLVFEEFNCCIFKDKSKKYLLASVLMAKNKIFPYNFATDDRLALKAESFDVN
ncbi:hypothetical protein CXB51_014723 [Gossypium anomalum]|uniref:Retrovirus-related Pol polyprotein from transposon TNT 1-94-like beta-barrel domain-containing protein n=1 Tax=Gossypium anomalum TaxID=47600 RepID=A0A8J5YZQ0_9ROSI|nr:hypothetical protein CXB51_014723 [Gossypium anomalum]